MKRTFKECAWRRLHDAGRKRPAVPRRRRCADGGDHAPPLDRGVPLRRGRAAGRRAGAREAARREPRGVPRLQRPARRARRILRAPPRLAGLRAQRGVRAALPLSRLEVRRGRQRGRDGLGARREQHSAAREAEGLSGARGRRLRVVLHGSGGRDAGVRAARVRADAGCARLRHQGARATATGRRSSKGRSTRRIPRACIPPTWCRRRSRARRRPTRTGCALRPTRRRASRSSARPTASATRRSAARSRTRRRTTTSAPPSTSRRSPR